MAKTKTAPAAEGIDVDAVVAEPVDADVEPEEETDEQRRERLNRAVVTITLKDEIFAFPKRKGRWRMGVHRDIDNDLYAEALIKLIGEERYASLDGSGWTLDDFRELSNLVGDAIAEQCIP